MNAKGKSPERQIDGLADTAMAMSSGVAFERTELSGRPESRGSGTLTEYPAGADRSRPRPADIQRDARYEVEGEHARGGLGRVLSARDTHLGRTVAIKELLKASTFAESLFIREALITARLQHPGIVPVHEAGRWPSGDPYYVMKLLSGEPLQTLIRKRTTLAERMALLPNVLHVVETIAYAHEKGIIHRDIKPANIIVGEFGETVVVDWGLARDDREPVPLVQALAGDAVHASFAPAGTDQGPGESWQVSGNYSVSGKVVGTPAYMSPEQARGDEVDERTDVYALGALMYEVLAGRPPYQGDHLQAILERVLAGPPESLTEILARRGEEVQPDLVTMIERAMARERDQRYPSAKELAEDLRRFQTGQLVSVHQYKTWTLVKRWIRRHRAPLAVALVAVLVLAGLGVLGVNRVVVEKNLAQAQRREAQAARDAMRRQNAELIFLQARNALHDDPTTTLAWLLRAPLDGAWFKKALHLTEEAVAMGVSRHVIERDSMSRLLGYTADGKTLLAVDMNGAVHALDVATGAERLLLARDDMYAHMAVLSPDRAILAMGTSTGKVVLQPLSGDARLAGEPRELEVEPGPVADLRFSNDGRHLWAGSRDSQVAHVFRAADGERVGRQERGVLSATLQPWQRVALGPTPEQVLVANPAGGEPGTLVFDLPAPVLRLVPNKSYTRVIAITGDNGLYQLDTVGQKVTRLGESHFLGVTDMFERVTLSSSGRWLVTRTPEPARVILWDLDSGTSRPLAGHQDTVFRMVFSPDERYLVTGSDDATVRIWDLETRDVQVLRGHTDDVFDVVTSPSGDTIASTGRDRSIRVWPVHSPESRRFATRAAEAFTEIAFLGPDTVAAATMDGHMTRMHPSTGQSEDIGQADHLLPIQSHAMSPDGRFVLAGNRPGVLELWDLAQGQKRRLESPAEKIVYVAWAPDSSGLATLTNRGDARVWLTQSEHSVVLPLGQGRCGIALAPGSGQVAVSGSDHIEIHDTRAAAPPTSIPIPGSRACNLARLKLPLAFSPDGRILAFAHPQRGIMVWNTADHSIREFPGNSSHANQLVFSPDSTRMALVHDDLSLYLLDLREGATRPLGYHQDLVYELVFSPDGNTLASSSYDRTIRLWDVQGTEHRTLRGHSHGVLGVAFSPDGKHLGSVSYDGTLRIWDLGTVSARETRSLIAYIQSQTSATVETTERARTPAYLR